MTDELLLMRDCLPEQPPPAPDVTAAARVRLAGLAHGAAHGAADGRPPRVPFAGMRPARRALLLRAAMPATAVTAAAAAAVAVIALIPAATSPAPSAARGPSASGAPSASAGAPSAAYRPYAGAVPAANAGGTDGRAVLLTAAMRVARAAESAPERYWVTTGTVGTFVQLGPADDRYMVLEEVGVQNWAARSPKDGSPQLAQLLGAAPVSAADRTAWQRDGSPAEWTYVGQSDQMEDPHGYGGGFDFPLTTAGGPLSSLDAGYGSQQFPVGATTLTFAQLRALPAEPAKLEKLIMAGGIAPGIPASAYLLLTVPAIMEMPVTPAVRAGLYQMLAGMPGMESLGQVTDPAGQQGEAIGYTATYQDCARSPLPGDNTLTSYPSCTTQQILIIDPATGMPVAEELRYVGLPSGDQWPAPDGLFNYELFGQSYWTNQNRPEFPPQSRPIQPQRTHFPAAPHTRPRAKCLMISSASTKPEPCPTSVIVGKTGSSR